jgi:hypothetical protein
MYLWSFGIFSHFGELRQEQSGNPANEAAIRGKRLKCKKGDKHFLQSTAVGRVQIRK